MKYLLDTNVISEVRKSKARAEPVVRAWAARQVAADLAVSVITIMEIEIGIARAGRRDVAQANVLRAWFSDDLLRAFDRRILPVDLEVARTAARMHVPDPGAERDVLIAATAITRGLTVVTRNTADFERLGVALIDPWTG